MAALTATSLYRFIVRATSDGQAIFNVFHYKWVPPSPPPAVAPTLGNAEGSISAVWEVLITNDLSTSYTAYEYDVIEIVDRDTSYMPAREVLSNEFIGIGNGVLDTGTVGGKALPSFVAASFKKNTGVGGRTRQGSGRVGVIAEADQLSEDVLNPARASALKIHLDAMVDVSLGAGNGIMKMVVYSKRLFLGTATIPPTPAITVLQATTPVIDTQVYSFLGSQVSRKVRRTRPG